jgi:hypothetical protein
MEQQPQKKEWTKPELMQSMSTVKPVMTRVPLRQQKSDFAYWQAQPYAARLAALEAIRREYHQWRYGAEPRLQRVCAIVKRK